MSTITMRRSFVVQRPQQDVFEYLTQIERHGEWSPKAWRVEGNPGPLTKGTTFTSYGWIPGDKEHRNDVEVTEFDPPSRIAWETTEAKPPGRFVNTFVLSPEGSGTRVDRTFEFPQPGGATRFIFPIIKALIVNPGFDKNTNMLRERLASGA